MEDNNKNLGTAAQTAAEDTAKFKGKYLYSHGKRKTANARIRLYENGSGAFLINNRKINQYFPDEESRNIVLQPLKLTSHLKDINLSVMVAGGGKKGQAEAVRHGIASVLLLLDPDLRPSLKARGWLTRDARKKERKKPGLKKARRAPQWSKR